MKTNRNTYGLWLLPLLGWVLMIFTFCSKNGPVDPPAPVNHPPVASLTITPSSGDSPLSAHITFTATDPDGNSDIKTYKLTVGSNTYSRSVPIDTTIIFTNPEDINIQISGTAIDSKNSSNTATGTISLYKGPFIDQSASLVNDAEINYSATLFKVTSATLTINKDGTLFLTKDLTANLVQTFKYNPDKLTGKAG